MGWPVTVNVDGLNRKFDTMAIGAADLEKPLKIFGGYLKAKAKRKYAEQNFEPLAESTLQKRMHKAMAIVERKLHRDVKRAFKRARLARGESGKSGAAGLLQDALGVNTRGVQNRLAVLAAFQRKRGARIGLKQLAEGRALTLKQQVSLDARTSRQVDRTVNGKILGGLDKTLVVIVEGGTVTLRSATHQEWSEAHNEGATVGHGAREPQRETIKLEPSDLDVFESILKAHLLLPFERGLQGPAF